ncbi:hypothetical protein ACIBTZ_31195 [Micromonospora sp. NPDC049460]|uniref:hypothetical protein n=1 Tax=Micromonospora sp. NPDC049460 TaxID=3364272 RepID=UPI0037B0BC04
MLSVEDWTEIRRLHWSEQMPIKGVRSPVGDLEEHGPSGVGGVGAAEVRAQAAGSVLDAVEPQTSALLASTPGMPVTVIAERVGWTRGLTVLSTGCGSFARRTSLWIRCRGRRISRVNSRSATCGSRRRTSRSTVDRWRGLRCW